MKYVLAFLVLVMSLAAGEAWACQNYHDVMLDRNGNVIAGVTVTVTYTGVATKPTLYTETTCTTTVGNPLTSGSDGSYSFYINDGEYGITFAKSGYTFTPLVRVSIYDPLGENIKTVGYYAGTDLCAAGVGAIDQIGATVTTLVINKPVTCSASKTIPSTLILQFMGSGTLTIASGQTLLVNSGISMPNGYFSGVSPWLGTGTVNFAAKSGRYPRGLSQGALAPAYGANISIDPTLADLFTVTVTDASAFAINNPTLNGALLYGVNQRILILIRNIFNAGIATPTFGTNYKLGAAFTSPATGKSRWIEFVNLGGLEWIELSRSAADVSY